MTLISTAKEAGIDWPGDSSILELTEDGLEAVQAASARLGKHVQEATITVKQIDSYVAKNLDSLPEPQRTYILEYLLSKKALLLFHQGQTDNSRKFCDETLQVKENLDRFPLASP